MAITRSDPMNELQTLMPPPFVASRAGCFRPRLPSIDPK